MKTLEIAEIAEVNGAGLSAVRGVLTWLGGNLAWEGLSAGFSSIQKSSSSGGQMNFERRSNMYRP